MIFNGLILVLQAILNVLLAPLSALNVAIDFLSGLPVVQSFLSVIFFVLPMDNLRPLFALIISIFIFRAVIALIKTIWELLPVL